VIAGKPLRGRNQWPPGLPGLRADMMAYFDALRAICDRMLPPFAMALALPDRSRNLSDQPRQHHEALVERPLPVDTARRHQQIRYRPLFDRLFPQSHPGRGHRVRSHLHLRRQSAPLPGGYLPRPCSRIRISFTRRVTAPRRRRAPSGRSHNAKSTRACPCSISNALSPTAAPPFAPIAATNRCANWCPRRLRPGSRRCRAQ
jgi:hypothetical protein